MTRSMPGKSLGFSLVEVTMAIGLMSFCLVAMLGMLPVGLSQERKSTDQMLALQALTAVVTDFKNSPAGRTQTPLYAMTVPAVGEAVRSESFAMDEDLKRVSGLADKSFDVSYRIVAPASPFASYQFSVRVSRSSLADPSAQPGVDFVESIVVKPAF